MSHKYFYPGKKDGSKYPKRDRRLNQPEIPAQRINSYMLEDPMYEYMEEKKRKEKQDRIDQLKALLESPTDSSSDEIDDDKDEKPSKKKKSSKKQKRKKRKQSVSASSDEHRTAKKSKRKKEDGDRHYDLDSKFGVEPCEKDGKLKPVKDKYSHSRHKKGQKMKKKKKKLEK